MSKNIVICFDGTGNEFGEANSNVVKLYSTLVINDVQVGYYHPGVGTMGAPGARSRIAKLWTRAMGLAFGAGLLDNVADAYRYLMDVYADGDRVYLFGFSRGAYTARVLGGVLRMFGLLCPGNHGHIPYVMRMYAARRRAAGRQSSSASIDEEFKYTFSRDLTLCFVGLWDTVSSIGWIYDPIKLPFTGRNSIIKTGRQVLAIHERRRFYRPLLWGDPEPGQDLKQVWFAGVHSDVGGTYPEIESGLSQTSLEWMLSEAISAGLIVDIDKALWVLGQRPPTAFPQKYIQPDPDARMHCSLKGAWWMLELLPIRYEPSSHGRTQLNWRIPLGRCRTIPDDAMIYKPALARIDPHRLPGKFACEPKPDLRANLLRLTSHGNEFIPSHEYLRAAS